MDTEQLYNLAADDILDKLAAIEAELEALNDQRAAYREVLTTFYKDGTINDKLDNGNGFKLNWQVTGTRWKYSDAIAKAQKMEQAEGIATKSVTYGWKKQIARPKF